MLRLTSYIYCTAAIRTLTTTAADAVNFHEINTFLFRNIKRKNFKAYILFSFNCKIEEKEGTCNMYS